MHIVQDFVTLSNTIVEPKTGVYGVERRNGSTRCVFVGNRQIKQTVEYFGFDLSQIHHGSAHQYGYTNSTTAAVRLFNSSAT